jgi:hypothetical protein
MIIEEKFFPLQPFQWEADSSRLVKTALRTHDPESLAVAIRRISLKCGSEVAENLVLHTITRLISSENWSFFDEKTGEPSPLI